MIGRTLTEIRAELESLTSADGGYSVRCGRTGERPVPVDGRRFPDRASAVEAVRVAHAYRATLRRYDPRAPWYDFVVCEDGEGDANPGPEWAIPPADGDAPRRALVAYCHDVAGAVFEALSASDHDAVERSVMDAYLAAAEETPDRDRLCLQLLAKMATELAADLSRTARADVLRRATAHLPTADRRQTPLADGLAHLQSVGLVDDYAVVDERRGRPRTVDVSGYAFAPVDGRLPTLPLSVEAFRRTTGRAPVVTRATARDEGGWRVEIASADDATTDPTTAPVRIDA